MNEKMCKVTGYTKEELIGKPHNILRHPSTPKETFYEMWKAIKKGKIWHGVFRNLKKDGSSFYAKITITPILSESDKIIEYIALRDDITELVKREQQLKKLFQTDSLTSLGNRFKLLDDIKKYDTCSLALIDIKALREINDFYGHKFGDYVIIALGNKLFETFMDDGVTLYRLHSDNFALLVDLDKFNPDQLEHKVISFIESIENNAFQIQNNTIHVRLTVGYCYGSEGVYTKAEIAHSQAKNQNRYFVKFTSELKTSEKYKENLKWINTIKVAISKKKIVPYFQSIVDNKTQKVSKYESLVRLIDETGEVISPFHFLEISKKARLYPAITKIMIDSCFEQIVSTKSLIYSVNLTAEDLLNNEIVQYLYTMLKDSRVGERIVFEIVESESITSFDVMESFCENVKQYGCKIAIDDFGTGYSNFEYLMKINADFIKIDGSMIKNIDTDNNAYSVVETIVDFAKKNRMKSIAEYVCSESVYKTVKDLGIDYS